MTKAKTVKVPSLKSNEQRAEEKKVKDNSVGGLQKRVKELEAELEASEVKNKTMGDNFSSMVKNNTYILAALEEVLTTMLSVDKENYSADLNLVKGLIIGGLPAPLKEKYNTKLLREEIAIEKEEPMPETEKENIKQ